MEIRPIPSSSGRPPVPIPSSTASIRQALIDMATEGAAVLAISQDLEELFEISNRIAVICEGRMSDAQPAENVTVEEIGLLMAGVGSDGEKAHAD